MKALYAYPVNPETRERLIETRNLQRGLFPAVLEGCRTVEIHGGETKPKDFCMAALLNGAIDRAISEHMDWLVMLDVDAILLHPIRQWPATGYGLIFKRNMEPGEGFDPLPTVFTHSSYFMLAKEVFTKHRFCEDFNGYGHEDWDYMETLRRADIRLSDTDARMMHRWHPPRPWTGFQEPNRKLYFERTGLTSPRDQ